MIPLNKTILAYYLTYQFIPKPLSLFPGNQHRRSAVKFPTSHHTDNTLKNNETAIATSLRARLNGAVRKSLSRTSGPVGLLLSGGLDSAIVLYLLRKNTRRKIYTLTGAYSRHEPHLRACAHLAEQYNTIHQELIMTPADLLRLPDLYSEAVSDPIGDNGFLATHLMCEQLSRHASLIYTGDGADCLFQGLQAHYLDHIDRHYHPQIRMAAPPAEAVTAAFHSSKQLFPDYAHYKYGEIFFTPADAQQYLGINADLIKPLKAAQEELSTSDPVKKAILLDLNFLVTNRIDYILSAITNKRIGIVLPYLSHSVVDLTLRIPSGLFIKNLEQKYILREAFRNILPSEILAQKKRGFTPPFYDWYTQNQSFVAETLHRAAALGVSEEYIRFLLSHPDLSRQYAHGMRIWLLLNLVLWHDSRSTRRKPSSH